MPWQCLFTILIEVHYNLMYACLLLAVNGVFVSNLFFSLVTYMILFGPRMRPMFGRTILLSPVGATHAGTASTGTSTSPPNSPSMSLGGDGKPTAAPKRTREFSPLPSSEKDVPIHNCTMSPEIVRDEVEVLKTDFNNRIKQVLFNSMMCAYYMGFVPLCFAQVTYCLELQYCNCLFSCLEY